MDRDHGQLSTNVTKHCLHAGGGGGGGGSSDSSDCGDRGAGTGRGRGVGFSASEDDIVGGRGKIYNPYFFFIFFNFREITTL